MMRKHKVMVRGENFYLSMDGKYRKVGFYTTVFTSAPNSLEAEQIAVRFIEDDPTIRGSVKNDPDDPPMLIARDIEELGPGTADPPERTGFAFYY